MATPRNEFLLSDEVQGTLTAMVAERAPAVARWVQTVFWNHYRKRPEPVAAPVVDYALDEDGDLITRRIRNVAGAYIRQAQLKDGRWATITSADPRPGRNKGVPKAAKRPMTPEEREQRKYATLYANTTPVIISSGVLVEGYRVMLFKELTDDAVKAVRNGADLVSLDMPVDHAQTLQHMIDFLTMYHDKHPDKDLSRISVPQCATMVLEWDKELARQKELEALKAGTQELHVASNGCTVYLLHSVEAVEREGQRLGNCLKSSASSYLRESGAIVIVRNAEGSTLSAAQLIVKLRANNEKLVTAIAQKQFYGRSNTAVPEEAEVAMQEMAKALDWRNADDPRTVWFPESTIRRIPAKPKPTLAERVARRGRPAEEDDDDGEYEEYEDNGEMEVEEPPEHDGEEMEDDEADEYEDSAKDFDPATVYDPPRPARRPPLKSPIDRDGTYIRIPRPRPTDDED